MALVQAQRDLADAKIARQRHVLEGATFTPAAGGGFNINGATFHFHGVQNIQELMEKLARLGKSNPSQTRGKFVNGGRFGGPQ